MRVLERSEYGGHWMLTLGVGGTGLRVTRGKLDRRGRFHDNWPCIFFLLRGDRV